MFVQTVSDARAILGGDVLGPAEIAATFGGAAAGDGPSIPFTRDELSAAHAGGEMLVLRVARVGDTPLTIRHMTERHPAAFDAKLLHQVGYQLKDEWGIALEPLAATEICTPGWALVRKSILDDSRNLPYDAQDEPLHSYAGTLAYVRAAHTEGVPRVAVARRSAVEAVYDTLLYFAVHKVRLLEKAWDWTSSRTIDGGYLNVGGFGPRGMQILSFSKAVRHGGLGVCPARRRVA